MFKLITSTLTCVGLVVVLIFLMAAVSAAARFWARKKQPKTAPPPPRLPRSRKTKKTGSPSAEPAPLDPTRIAAIVRETEEVNVLLATAMKSEEPPPVPPPSPLESAPPVADASRAAPQTDLANAAPIAPLPENTESGPATPPPEPASAPPPDVPARYAGFYAELTRQARWPRTEAELLARRHGLMLGGALEAINDWAFETLGAPLLHEEGEQIVVDQSLL